MPTKRFTPPRALTLTLNQIKKILAKHNFQNTTNLIPTVLNDFCNEAGVKTPRSITRAITPRRKKTGKLKVGERVIASAYSEGSPFNGPGVIMELAGGQFSKVYHKVTLDNGCPGFYLENELMRE